MEELRQKETSFFKRPIKSSQVFFVLAFLLIITGIGFIIAGCAYSSNEGIVDGVGWSKNIGTMRGIALIIIGICSMILGLTSAVLKVLSKMPPK